MVTSLYVGNLNFATDDKALKSLFEAYGAVTSSKIIMDRETGRSRGFGFIEMEEEAANTALTSLNGKEVEGRILKVTVAAPRQPRPSRPYVDRSNNYNNSYNNSSSPMLTTHETFENNKPSRFNNRDRSEKFRDRDRGYRD